MAMINQERIKNFGRVGVLMGGTSTEREISLKSGQAVFKALNESGIEAVSIDIKTDNIDDNRNLLNSHKINCAFLALHGRFGEDGQIQRILESMKLPYTGSGVLASELAMDKVASRRIFEKNNLNVPAFKVVNRGLDWEDFLRNLDFSLPLVIKPASHGSSIGLSIISEKKDLPLALESAFSYDERVIIEEYILGREVTVGILGNEALPVIEIIPKKSFFDYEAKYKPGMTEYVVPAELENDIAGHIQESALKAHQVLGCSGCSRVDMILNKKDLPFVLEVNTIPGLTDISLLPKAAKKVGISFCELCIKLIELAYEKDQSHD